MYHIHPRTMFHCGVEKKYRDQQLPEIGNLAAFSGPTPISLSVGHDRSAASFPANIICTSRCNGLPPFASGPQEEVV